MATEVGSDLVEQALELATRSGADQAEAFYVESASDSVDYQNNRLAGIDSSTSRGIGIRVITGGRVGFSSTSILDRVGDAVEAALSTARLTEPERHPFELPAERSIDSDISDPEVEEKPTRRPPMTRIPMPRLELLSMPASRLLA